MTDVESPLDARHRATTVSKDGRSVVVNFTMPGKDEQVDKAVDKPLAAVAAVQKAHPEVRVEEFGDASAGKALDEQGEKDKQKSELFSLPLTLVILLIAFGAIVAAGLPILLALTAVMGTVGLQPPRPDAPC